MLEKLGLRQGMNVLEIGAGTGWNAALMGQIVGPKGRVCSVDIQADVARRARRHIRRQASANVTILTADGGKGYDGGAPYDRIVTTVSCPTIPPAWTYQLKQGGSMLITLQDIPGETWCLMVKLQKRTNHLRGRIVGLPGFMTLMGAYAAESTDSGRFDTIRRGRPSRHPAPWESWGPWLANWLRRDLLFFASLQGLIVEPFEDSHVISDPTADGLCVATDADIRVYGDGRVYLKFEQSVQKWLDLGAPRRDDYSLEVWPSEERKKVPSDGWVLHRRHAQLIFRLKKQL